MLTDPGPSSSNPPKLPYFEELTWDEELKIINENFINELKEEKSKELQLDSVVAFPEPKIFAHFASKAYQNKEVDETLEQFEERLQLPEGWKLLTMANNFAFLGAIRGYFGAVFWHPVRRRIVIAHRGTDPTNLDALRADLNGILLNKYVKQMRAACTLTHRIFEAVKECEIDRNTYFEIYFTGHSLGAWLAQVTTFYLKYMTLERKTMTFLKNPHPDGGRHAHTEVFDSPGSSETLRQMASDFDVRYSGKSTDSDHLDITIYLSSPNFVNCCNSHVGRLYRVYPKIESNEYVKYTLSSHSMDGILEIFNSSDTFLMKEVVDWPKLEPSVWQWKIWKIHKSILGKEYEDFFEWAKDLNYDPKPEDIALKVTASKDGNDRNSILDEFVTIRYQTKPTRANQCSPSVFAESELKFLRNFQQLKFLPNSIFDGDEIKKKTIEKLRQLALDDQSVSCNDNANIRQLIPYVKTLLRLYPDLNERVESALTDFEIRKQIYRDLTESYLDKMEGLTEMLRKPEWSRLDEFLESENQVCRVSAEIGTDFTAAKVIKIIYAKHQGCTVFAFELQSLLGFETFFHLTEFIRSEKLNQALILFECKSGSFSSSESVDFVQGVINRVGERSDLKLILIIDKKEAFIFNNDLESIIDEGITWDELTNETKKIVVKKEVVVFQGNKRCLEELLCRTSTKMDLNQLADIVDAKTLARFLRDENVIVGECLTKSGDIYVTRKFKNKPYVNETLFKDEFHKYFKKNDIIAISGISQINLDGIKNEKIKIITSDEEFEELLRSYNAEKNVHWLKYEYQSNSYVFHKTRGSLDLIRNHIERQKVLEYSEDKLLEIDRKTLIISDLPGMGKTTILSVLADKIKAKSPDLWVVRVNLNDCTEALKTTTQFKTVSDAARFLLEQILPLGKDTKLNSNFEKKLFEHALMIYGGVVLLFDGFDEISPNYEDTVTSLLESLQRTKVDLLVVTTKPHTKLRLEDGLSTLSHSMVPFSKENRKELLIEIWKKRFNGTVEEEELETYADESKEFLEKSINDREKSFLGIPLHCVMLADYVIEKFLNQQKLEVLPLFDLYEAFVRSKMNIYHVEKGVNTKGNVLAEKIKERQNIAIEDMHWQYARRLILSDDTLKEFTVTDYQQKKEEQISEPEILMVGLIINTGNKPKFLHRTFAEFFLLDGALNLAKNKEENLRNLTILSTEILLKKEFNIVRTFLESLIKNKNRQTETNNFLQSFVEFWLKNWSTNRTVCLNTDGGTVLHILLDERHFYTIKLFLNITLETQKASLSVRNGNFSLVRLLTGKISNIDTPNENQSTRRKNKSAKIFDARDYNKRTVIHIVLNLAPKKDKSGLYKEIIQLLLENGANIEANHDDGSSPLIKASSEGHLDIVSLLVENGANINAIDNSGTTPLGVASFEGHKDVVAFLLRKKAAIDESTQFPNFSCLLFQKGSNFNNKHESTSPLLKASFKGNLEIVDLLIDNGADINARDTDGSTPLEKASSEGHLEVVRHLLDKKANVNAKEKHGSTPLIEASYKGRLKVLSVLLKYGADINASDDDGSSPLGKASSEGHLDVVCHLLENGADINASCGQGSTPLIQASSEGHLEIVRHLLDNKADTNARDKNGSSPLIEASYKGHLNVIDLLLKNGANINARDNDGLTSLGKASYYDKRDSVTLLLKKNADVNASDCQGTTPLMIASSAGHLEIVRLILNHIGDNNDSIYLTNSSSTLMSKEASVNSVDNFPWSPLHYASDNGHSDVVRHLLDNKANVNVLGLNNSTPLHLASKSGHLETVQILLDKGANHVAKNRFNKTPLDLAIKYKRGEVIQLLISRRRKSNIERNSCSRKIEEIEKIERETIV